jgi:hypothetical protein
VFSSLEEVSERLRSTGYIADSIATTTVHLAAKLHKPLLLEMAKKVMSECARSPRNDA